MDFLDSFLLLKDNPLLMSLAIILATFILEDPTTLFVGHLIALNHIGFWHGFYALMVGIFLGDFGLYIIGRLAKKGLIRRKIRPLKSRQESLSLLFLARFVPGMRMTFYPFAGYQQYNVARFIVVNLSSGIVWTYILLKTSESLTEMLVKHVSAELWVLIALGLIGVILLERWIRKKVSARFTVDSSHRSKTSEE